MAVGSRAGFALSFEQLFDFQFINSESMRMLLEQGTIEEAQLKGSPQPVLIPQHTYIRTLVYDTLENLEPSFFIESLHVYKKPSGTALPVWNKAEQDAVFNQILALSTLAGIQYYSTTRKMMRIFYETSAVIDGPDTKLPLADPVYSRAPAELTLYARQKDLTFGDNIYQYTYHVLDDALVFVQQNVTPLTVGILPAVGKNKLQTIVALIDAEEYLLIYVASMAKAVAIPGMNQQVGKSFSTRAEALLQWFDGQVAKAFAQTGH
jgi:hypothetical protein